MIKYVLQISHYIFSHHSLIFLKGKSPAGGLNWETGIDIHTTTYKVDN